MAYASRSLPSTAKNYAAIEKELLAVLFGCERFHQYIYGNKTLVESDRKSLESIIKKPLARAPAGYRGCCYDYRGMISSYHTNLVIRWC